MRIVPRRERRRVRWLPVSATTPGQPPTPSPATSARDPRITSAVPPERVRPPQSTIPQTRVDREEFKRRIAAYVDRFAPVPPLSFAELRRHSDEFLKLNELDGIYRDYVAVVLNSEVWKE